MLFHRDLAATPYKEKLLGDLGQISYISRSERPESLAGSSESVYGNVVDVLVSPTLNERGGEILKFLNAAEEQAGNEVMPLIFPTRPLSAEEVTICAPDSALETDKLIQYVNALRGTWQREGGNGGAPRNGGAPNLPSDGPNNDDAGGLIKPPFISVKTNIRKKKPVIALTSFQTDNESWCQAAAGQEDLSRNRYTRLERLCRNIIEELSLIHI